MRNNTIVGAIKMVLQAAKTSMTPRAIFEEIIRNNYYTFGAQNPFGVMRSELRTHSEGIDFPTASPRKYFKYLPDGTFTLLDPDNIVKTKKKYKVTYKMIKDYIKEKYGFGTHTSYIAEVKRDLGLEMINERMKHNPKNPVKHPTQKHRDAIEDALKHFKLI